ncbi:MAG: arginase [Fimbriimonadaceae bacterium]
MNLERRPVEIWGAPFDLCGRIYGARLGPGALRLKQIRKTISDLGYQAIPMGDVVELDYELPASYSEKMDLALVAYAALSMAIEGSVNRGAIPLVLGGDHSLSMGSVSGALKAAGTSDTAVLWIDAHMDLNTPSSSASGNFHGMPVAALVRLGTGSESRDVEAPSYWNRILEEVVPQPGLQTDHVGWLGLRDVDSGEIANYSELGMETAWTMHDVDHHGIPAVLQEIDAWLRRIGAKKVWVSFDVDSLDPVLAPGTGTAVRGGLTYREGHLLAELLFEMLMAPTAPYELLGLDLVEVNPMEDIGSNTTIAAVEWVASLFGKRTMQGRNGR